VRSVAGTLSAPFPYFGGKSLACESVWAAIGNPENYVEPFAGSAAMLLGRPSIGHTETINDADGFVANFWRAIAKDAQAVAAHADWPCNEADLFARHSWLVRERTSLLDQLHADPEWFDAKMAGWWCWGSCNWIGSGWCSGDGPWVHNGEGIVDARKLPHLGDAGRGINRQLPHLGNAGRGINRQLPHLGNAGRGINRQLPHLGNAGQGASAARSAYILEWFTALQARMRGVRVACGDWSRVLKDSVTTRHGLTGVFLDPPYTKGAMDYAAKGTGGAMADAVRQWCKSNGDNRQLRIVLCGHAGEHDELLADGWHTREWTARKGYATTDAAIENSASETLWCSPHCVPLVAAQLDIFSVATA
jgi:site-specific DNA-adenine methylase